MLQLLSFVPKRAFVFMGIGAVALVASKFTGGAEADVTIAGQTAENNVVEVATGDRAMEAAVVAAQAKLDRFLAVAATGPAEWQGSNLKAALHGETRTENIWIAEFRQMPDGRFSGKLGNDPVDLPGKKAGDVVTFDREQITDWAFIEGGRGYGFYTVRALLPTMDAEQAAGMRAFLAEDPLPAGW